LTTARLVSGLAACVCFALGTRAGLWWGGWLWLFSAFLDRADGELARVGNMMSAAGHRYDYRADVTVNTLLFASAGIGLRGSWLGSWAIGLGLIAATSMLLCGVFAESLQLRSPPGTRAYYGRWGFDPDDALYLIAPIAWLGWMSFIVIGTAVVAPILMVSLGIRLQGLVRVAAGERTSSLDGLPDQQDGYADAKITRSL
jgi:archaetidylinositol phosphate synthase